MSKILFKGTDNMNHSAAFLRLCVGLFIAASSVVTGAFAPASEKPNILIVFTDDQGYADLACYGNEKNKTPRLDQLAKEGTRFTSFYAQTVCGPSRSALLTGRYPIRSKGWGMPASEITFAELMRESGYQTACIGKWDVSNRKPIIDRMPNAQGFDYYFGTLGANDGGGVGFHENNEQAGSTRDMGSLTTLYTNKAISYLKEKRDPSKPFVLYVAHTMMHTIIDASERFRGKSAGGLYGDVVEEFDYETGRLLDVLDELDLSQNTLVIYTSDNGPWNQPKYTKKKRAIPKAQSSGAKPGRCAMARVPATKQAIASPALFAGRARCPRVVSPMRFSPPSTSCPPLQRYAASRYPMTAAWMASIKPS